MSEALKTILVKKMLVKHALEQYRKMMKLTGMDYEKEVNELLEQLQILTKIEKELTKKK
ncbi:MAG: hypothetical protein QM763_04785 [Agriterribacter sp.]